MKDVILMAPMFEAWFAAAQVADLTMPLRWLGSCMADQNDA
jgi:hypothetical protein